MLDDAVVFDMLEDAKLLDLYHLSKSVEYAMKAPNRIKEIREQFREGDVIEWFNEYSNQYSSGIVLKKQQEYVLLQDLENPKFRYKVPYCRLKVENDAESNDFMG